MSATTTPAHVHADSRARSRWRTTRYLLSQFLPLTLLGWLGLLVLAAVGNVVIASLVGDSAWNGVTQLARWYAAGVGAYVVSTLLPLHVAHGQTRRAFLQQAAPFSLAAASVLAVLATAGFLLENAFLRRTGWTEVLAAGWQSIAPNEAPVAVAAFWMVFAAWLLAGAVVAAGAYRDDGTLLLAIPVAVLPIVAAQAVARGLEPSEAGVGFDIISPWESVTRWVLGGFGLAPGAGLVLWAIGCLLAVGLTWRLARDLPIRARRA
jgi:hypothetical protein